MKMSKSKQIGTAAESALVRYFKARGWPSADRIALRGSLDIGDIHIHPHLCIESKSGHAAESASDGQVAVWLAETERERVLKGADFGILIMKRKGVGLSRPGRWWAVTTARTYDRLRLAEETDVLVPEEPVRFSVDHLTNMLWASGYGESIPAHQDDMETS
jgi:hypothetical protein